MRLKCIKLAGFKSFVDPTTVNFPSNMAAVVGPNGCGKSNIIDAVRWVMGESSAKNLRGESMTDVIFNGSNTRKPVSQASIELIFDNSDNSLVGEYAAYAEISIRRRVSRDGQNTYFLNGTKCRRRDITDIFLGTGLGPRSYSIIEQGMISKLIEAKPEELRNFIEEAAGISKYKERRRETENRIRRTQENLARLTDLREELERQLERLHRQAQSAEKYQQYKVEERSLKAQLAALKWRELNEQVGQRERVIGDQEIAYEALVAEQRNADAGIERLRDGHHDLSERFNQVQARFYSVGNDITRVEQSIQHGQQRLRQLQQDLAEAKRAEQEAQAHLSQDRELLEHLAQELEMLEPLKEEGEMAVETSAAVLAEAEEQLASWQERWEQFNQQSAAPRQTVQVEQSRIAQLEQSLERLAERGKRLTDENQQLSDNPDDLLLAELAERLAEGELALEALSEQEQAHSQTLAALKEQILAAQNARHASQGQLQRNQGRLASLEALQQAALNPEGGAADWLEAQGLTHAARLGQKLKVEPGWELAVETVLGADLQAVLVDDPGKLSLSVLADADIHLLALSQGATGTNLLSKVRAPVDLAPWLEKVIPVASLDEALNARANLSAGQSLISQDGYWIGRNFVRVKRAAQSQGSVLARAQELEGLNAECAALKAQLAQAEENLASLTALLSHTEQLRDAVRAEQQVLAKEQAQHQAQLSASKARVEQLMLRKKRLEEELTELEEQRLLEQEQLAEARMLLEQALEHMALDTEKREALTQEREGLRERVEAARREARQHAEQNQQLALKLSTLKAQYDSTQQALVRLEMQFARAQEKGEQLWLNLEEGEAPLEELRMQLEELLEKRMSVDEELALARNQLEDADRELREFEKRRTVAEQQTQVIRTQLEAQRLDWQALTVRRKALQEQLETEGYALHAVLETLPLEARDSEWEAQLEALSQRIARLGAINLAAIDEYQQQGERKRYLDAQNDDLVEALETLENVIRKIDKETRNRFKETFDQVNSGLKALFPKVFGGGSAYLELTGEDLLDTGVSIMARPPGKKNSTIHLLSGGEKALTALALVFAIFQLNPAPFCMLDEVDAPLDDTNVGRYARLVKEMSEKVQFIYITHNKIAMEMADQLMGVTMHEPGCSRLVAVDVEEALAMVES